MIVLPHPSNNMAQGITLIVSAGTYKFTAFGDSRKSLLRPMQMVALIIQNKICSGFTPGLQPAHRVVPHTNNTSLVLVQAFIFKITSPTSALLCGGLANINGPQSLLNHLAKTAHFMLGSPGSISLGSNGHSVPPSPLCIVPEEGGNITSTLCIPAILGQQNGPQGVVQIHHNLEQPQSPGPESGRCKSSLLSSGA